MLLQMIYEVISNPEPPEPDLVNKVQRAHMIGLRARDPQMRKRFFKHFESSVVKSRGLFQRITHIVQKQEWDAIGDSYWLKHAVELILNIANTQVRVGEGRDAKNVEEWRRTAKKREGVEEVLGAHDAFLNEAYQLPMSALLEPLCELMHHSNVLAHSMWVEVFPSTWETLSPDEHHHLSKPLAMLIARDCNKFQDLRRPNVVQGLLEAVHRCKPPPAIQAPILKFAGRTFNAWHSALSILEDQMNHLSNYSDGSEHKGEEIIDALTDLYKRLGEQDVMYGLWSRQCKEPHTKVAISYLQYGYWSKAQDTLFNVMVKATHANSMNSVSKQEKMVWDEQWVQCGKHLNQWDQLTHYAKEVGQYDLQLECYWKKQEWANLSNLLPQSEPMPSDPSQTKIYEIYMALQEGRLPDADKLCGEAFNYALKSWCLLPDVTVQAYVPLMQTFHQLVELHESALLLDEVNKSIRHNSVPELKNTITAWRERLPNKWDDITVWYELLTWRNCVFKMLMDSNQNLQPDIKSALQQLGTQQETWTLLKLSEAARKQSLPMVCISTLQRLQHPAQQSDAQHQFTRLREEALCRLEMGSVQEMTLGLSTINKVNFDPPSQQAFTSEQRAELLRIKGELLLRIPDSRAPSLTRVQDACDTMTTSCGMNERAGKAWVTWGNALHQQLINAEQKGGNSAAEIEKRNKLSEHAMNCYLQGVKHNCDRARMLLSKVLWIVDQYDDLPAIGQEFDKNVDTIPSWNWICWIPMLLGALSRQQAPRFRKLLCKLASDYPQALYCPLRRFLIEKQGQSKAADSDTPVPQSAKAANTPTAAGAAAPAAVVRPMAPVAAAPALPAQVPPAAPVIASATHALATAAAPAPIAPVPATHALPPVPAPVIASATPAAPAAAPQAAPGIVSTCTCTS